MSERLSSDLASLRIDREAAPPSGGRLRLVIAVVLLVALGAVAYFVLVPLVRDRVFKTEIEITEIALVSPAQAQVNFASTGYVVPETVSQVAAKVAGRVAKAHAVQGGVVKPGDVLVELDRTDQEAAVRSARARVAAASAAAQTARAQATEARNQSRLARDMFDRGVGARSTSVDADARLRSLEAGIRAAQAQANAMQQEVAALEIDLENYNLRAPIGGTVLNKPPEVGEMVGPTFGGVASQLGGIEIADFATLVVETDVPEGRLHMVKIGAPAEISLDAFPSRRYRGKVKEILPRVNRAKATVAVKVAFVDPTEGVLPDMSARTSFLTAELDAAAMKEPPKKVVPRAAVVRKDGATVVFTVDEERVRMVPVVLGAEFGDGYVLEKGPDLGTKVVANPPADLSDGQTIKEKSAR